VDRLPCRLSEQYPSINSPAARCCTSRARRDARCTLLRSPVCRDTRRLVLASHLPSRAAPTCDPHSARCSAGCHTSRDFVLRTHAPQQSLFGAGLLASTLILGSRRLQPPRAARLPSLQLSNMSRAKIRESVHKHSEECLRAILPLFEQMSASDGATAGVTFIRFNVSRLQLKSSDRLEPGRAALSISHGSARALGTGVG
jgi:hypothetical protein